MWITGHLHSAVWGDLAVPCFRTLRHGQKCFTVSGPTLWNSLPLTIHNPSLTLAQHMKHQLSASVTAWAARTVARIHIYLLTEHNLAVHSSYSWTSDVVKTTTASEAGAEIKLSATAANCGYTWSCCCQNALELLDFFPLQQQFISVDIT